MLAATLRRTAVVVILALGATAGRDAAAVDEPVADGQWWLARVGADRVRPPGPGVPVVIVDSGVDAAHPEFAGRSDTTFLNPQTFTNPDEPHGTAVASIVGARADGVGIAGIYPAGALQIWDVSPRGSVIDATLVAALAAAPPHSVVSLSVGNARRDAFIEHAVRRAVERGVLVVAAAGNDGAQGNHATFPGAQPHVLTVGATDRDDAPAGFSTRAPTVDVAAPGVDIDVAVPHAVDADGYGIESGTSFAAPIVAGAAAWIWTLRPELDNTQLVELLRRTARDVGPRGRDEATGAGIVDVAAALVAPAPPVDPGEPNDDVPEATIGTEAPKPPLTDAASPNGTVRARVDTAEDPRDLYRVFVPADGRVTVAASSQQDVDLEVWSARALSVLPGLARPSAYRLARSARAAAIAERVSVRNEGRRSRFVYVSVLARSPRADYTLTVTALRPRRGAAIDRTSRLQ